MPAAMPNVRDKLAQSLMVGVRDGDDARAVVTNYRVGGILIGSDTDLSILTNGVLKDIVAGSGPLPVAVNVDEEGGRVSRLKSLLGGRGPRRGSWPAPTPSTRSTTWRCSGAAR
ncbi:beta-N-acetylhexosaminidase domain protein [Mycobacterium ulcerans str. Harvey]|uniref:Beta-N-acetylhexosaminidase domain protein n=1 Tax=Mycobacterium ulcerans str. Harvey TaxID=1299332 RepID=A0ABP3ANT3_MYCUL|nr:beta-N-acetylhexosaminidase domain protein [Mycobacterium ulcerans str. Harvey]